MEEDSSMAPLPRRLFKALKDQIQEVQINQKPHQANKIYTDSESISQNGGQSDTKSPGSAEIRVESDQAYTDKDHVAAYIHIYRKLPPNYITKAEARSLGWKDKGTLDQVAPGKSIGGDRFSNYEKSSLTLRGAAGKNATLTTSGGTGTQNVSVSPTMALSTTPHPTIRI